MIFFKLSFFFTNTIILFCCKQKYYILKLVENWTMEFKLIMERKKWSSSCFLFESFLLQIFSIELFSFLFPPIGVTSKWNLLYTLNERVREICFYYFVIMKNCCCYFLFKKKNRKKCFSKSPMIFKDKKQGIKNRKKIGEYNVYRFPWYLSALYCHLH